jgi:hypothetical protein
VENGLVWMFALCGYSTAMTRYHTGEVLEMRYYWREGSANAKLVFRLGSGERVPGSSRQPLYLNREVSIQLGFHCQAFSTRDLFVSMPRIHNL